MSVVSEESQKTLLQLARDLFETAAREEGEIELTNLEIHHSRTQRRRRRIVASVSGFEVNRPLDDGIETTLTITIFEPTKIE